MRLVTARFGTPKAVEYRPDRRSSLTRRRRETIDGRGSPAPERCTDAHGTGNGLADNRASSTEADGRVFLRGVVEDNSMVMDLLNFLNGSRRTGALILVSGENRKAVYVRDGNVIAGRSNQPEDRFGNVMFRMGLIRSRALDEALRAVRPGVKIGNVLLSRGLLNTKDLWNVIRTQIEEIVYSAVMLETGEFSVAHYDASQVPTRTAINTQSLLMEGARRKDEMAQMLSELPAGERPLARASPNAPGQLTEVEKRLLELVDGRRSIESLCRDSGLGMFEAVRVLHRFHKADMIRECAGRIDTLKRIDGQGMGDLLVRRVLERYNNALARVHGELSAHERGRLFARAPQSFFRDLSPEIAQLFVGVGPNERGQIPEEPVVQNLERYADQDRLPTLRRGLDEYLEFMLFLARETLEYHQVERLAVDVDSDLGRLPS